MFQNNFIKDFLKKNWWLLWILLSIAIFLMFSIYFRINTLIDSIEKENKNADKMVVLLSPNGTVIPARQVILSEYDKRYQKAIQKILNQNMILDGAKVTFGFQKIPTLRELVRGYPNLFIFYKYYLTPNARIQYQNILRKIIGLINQENYPDYISIINSNIQSYLIRDNHFKITINTTVSMSYTDIQTNLHKNMINTIIIYAEGYFDDKARNFDDPLGIKFNKISITLPKIRNENI